MSELIKVQDVHKTYATGDRPFVALCGVSLSIPSGEFVAVMGPSGSGKSTLLHLLGGLDRPTSGEVVVAGQPLHAMSETQLALFRRRHVGFVFQFFNLITNLTVRDNIELPALLDGRVRGGEVSRRADGLMETLGIAPLAVHSSTSLTFSWPTSQLATWTRPVGVRCCGCSNRSTRRDRRSCW
jgi:putative ABC transport system ATP-binding protein